MPGTTKPPARSLFARLVRRLTNRPDSEHELTLNRLGLSLVAFLCLFIGFLGGGDGHQQLLQDIGIYFILYTVATLFLFAHLVAYPGISLWRRLLGIPLDLGGVAYLMHIGGELTSFTYPIFLWAIFGNGFRFGVQYLFISAVVGFVAFLSVVVTTPFWYENRELSGGLLAGLIILPIYASVLIRRLSEAKRQAEEASRAKSLFLASISHELRTPLNAVIGLSDVLVGSGLSREQGDMARTIGKSGRSLLSLINSLLDLSRMELGKKPQMGEFDLHELLRDVRSMLLVQAQAKGVGLHLHLDPKLPRRVLGSTRHFEEVLINLVGNAIKFTSHGYVLIDASLVAEGEATRLRFDVTDTGIGIAPEAQARIFESFTQADETIIDRFGGTGLGLSIARQLVEAHGGRIGVESKPGHGSIFWFEIEVGAVDHATGTVRPDVRVLARPDLIESLTTLRPAVRALEVGQSLAAALQAFEGEAGVLAIDSALLSNFTDADFRRLDRLQDSGEIAALLLLRDGDIVSHDQRRHFMAHLVYPCTAQDFDHALELFARHDGGTPGTTEAAIPVAQRSLDILVAEDNRTNQLVITQILARGGHHATIVENGDLAVDALLNRRFDLVLMDLNMPVMNGIEASKFYYFAVPGDEAVPIIALTADATVETARKCQEAGMVACLNKPIEARALLAMVEKCAGPSPTENPVLAASADVLETNDAPNASQAIDMRALSDLASLGGGSFVSEIVTQFVSDAAVVLKELSRSVQERDVEGFRDHAHALRSCAANVGAQAVYRRCLDLRAIEAHELAASGEAHVRSLEEDFEQARAALAAHIG